MSTNARLRNSASNAVLRRPSWAWLVAAVLLTRGAPDANAAITVKAKDHVLGDTLPAVTATEHATPAEKDLYKKWKADNVRREYGTVDDLYKDLKIVAMSRAHCITDPVKWREALLLRLQLPALAGDKTRLEALGEYAASIRSPMTADGPEPKRDLARYLLEDLKACAEAKHNASFFAGIERQLEYVVDMTGIKDYETVHREKATFPPELKDAKLFKDLRVAANDDGASIDEVRSDFNRINHEKNTDWMIAPFVGHVATATAGGQLTEARILAYSGNEKTWLAFVISEEKAELLKASVVGRNVSVMKQIGTEMYFRDHTWSLPHENTPTVADTAAGGNNLKCAECHLSGYLKPYQRTKPFDIPAMAYGDHWNDDDKGADNEHYKLRSQDEEALKTITQASQVKTTVPGNMAPDAFRNTRFGDQPVSCGDAKLDAISNAKNGACGSCHGKSRGPVYLGGQFITSGRFANTPDGPGDFKGHEKKSPGGDYTGTLIQRYMTGLNDHQVMPLSAAAKLTRKQRWDLYSCLERDYVTRLRAALMTDSH